MLLTACSVRDVFARPCGAAFPRHIPCLQRCLSFQSPAWRFACTQNDENLRGRRRDGVVKEVQIERSATGGAGGALLAIFGETGTSGSAGREPVLDGGL